MTKTHEILLQQNHEVIAYDWQEYNRAIAELNSIKDVKERLRRAVDYMTRHDLSDDRYLYLFETARKVAELIQVEELNSLHFFDRYLFVSNSFNVMKRYFDVDDVKLFVGNGGVKNIFVGAEYMFDSKEIRVYTRLPFKKKYMLCKVDGLYHEFWHHMQRQHSKEIEFFLLNEVLDVESLRMNFVYKFVLYASCPLEKEAYFAGRALLYFLNKKTQFKYATKKMKELAYKDDKTVINVLRDMGKMKL